MDSGRAHQVQPGVTTVEEDSQVAGDEEGNQGRQVGGGQQENCLHAL